MERKIKTAVANPRAVSAIDRHIGERIRARRLELNLSQEQLAAAIGVTFQQVQKYERGFNRVSAATLFRICKVLEVTVASLLPMAKVAQGKADAVLDELTDVTLRLDGEQRKAVLDYAKRLKPVQRRARKDA